MTSIDALDHSLFHWLRLWHAPWLDSLMTWISASGGGGLVWLLLAGLALAMPRHRAAAWRVILGVALSYALVDAAIKPLVARPRPDVAALAGAQPSRSLPALPQTYSFPSGHATATFSAAITVSRMWPHTRVVWWLLAILIGYSRVYLGHHYPFDIVGGALLGVAVGFWVLGGRHRATDASTLPTPLPAGVIVRP
jgi:undecaprenyl-diphosphatase